MPAGEGAAISPVRRRAPSVEQAGLGKQIGPGAYRGGPACAPGRGRDPIDDVVALDGGSRAHASRDEQRVVSVAAGPEAVRLTA